MKLPVALGAGLFVAFVGWFANHTLADDGDEVITAIKSGLEQRENFDRVHRFIVGDGEQAKWRKINWYGDLWEARIAASRQRKPLFIWAMNGNPLGCV